MSKSRITFSLKQPVAQTPVAAPARIFNPLDHVAIASSDDQMTSLSRIENEDVGMCPKCKKPMITAIIANDDTVYYCVADRVSTPMPDPM